MTATIGHGVYVAPSKALASRGVFSNGLFAGRFFRKGQKITEYIGENISEAEADRRMQAGHGTHLITLLHGTSVIDGIRADMSDPNTALQGIGGGSLVNDLSIEYQDGDWVRITQEDETHFTNAKLESDHGVPARGFVVAIRDIYPNEEISVKYSNSYWKRSQIHSTSEPLDSSLYIVDIHTIPKKKVETLETEKTKISEIQKMITKEGRRVLLVKNPALPDILEIVREFSDISKIIFISPRKIEGVEWTMDIRPARWID